MIAWEETGSGPAAVLVHGITEDRRAWDSVVPLLADHFRCVRLDLPGHGASTDDDCSVVAMADALASVVDEAGIDEAPLVVGHSLGAVVATIHAAQSPVRAVVGIDQELRFGDFATTLAPLAEMLRGPGFHDALRTVFDALGNDGVPDDIAQELTAMHDSARQEVVLGVWGGVLDGDPSHMTEVAEATLGAIAVPYLAIHGNAPGDDYVAWLEAHLPTVTVEVWGNGGHYPHLADPERFAARLVDFDATNAGAGTPG